MLLRPRYSGLCHSDLHFIDGLFSWPLPAVLGHETAGVVEAVGSEVTYVSPGDHVVTCLSVFCGICADCLTGHPNRCSDTTVKLPPGTADRLSWRGRKLHQFLNLSSFAELMLVHEHALVRIDPEIPLDRATLVGCGVVTGVCAVTNAAQVRFGSTVAVIGCGGIGLPAVNGAVLSGASRVIAIDLSGDKLAIARTLGATDTVNPGKGDVIEIVRELTGGGVDYSFEALGLAATVQQALRMLRPGGLATIIGMVPSGQPIEISGMDLLMDRRLQGTIMGGNRFRHDMPRLLDFWKQGKLHLDHLMGDVIALSEVNEGFDQLRAGTRGRILIDMHAA